MPSYFSKILSKLKCTWSQKIVWYLHFELEVFTWCHV